MLNHKLCNQYVLVELIILVTLSPVNPYSAREFCKSWFIFSIVAKCLRTPSRSLNIYWLQLYTLIFYALICSQSNILYWVCLFMLCTFCSVRHICWSNYLPSATPLFLALTARFKVSSRKSKFSISSAFSNWRCVN